MKIEKAGIKSLRGSNTEELKAFIGMSKSVEVAIERSDSLNSVILLSLRSEKKKLVL